MSQRPLADPTWVMTENMAKWPFPSQDTEHCTTNDIRWSRMGTTIPTVATNVTFEYRGVLPTKEPTAAMRVGYFEQTRIGAGRLT